jgi:type IV pilus assembly protein PilB
VTGPSGSGKSTTLYAILDELKKRNVHLLTVEDPVEYDMDGVEQVQISLVKGYTFAQALRQFLRHDPDVIMVGEIRDGDTAQIANKAALTGHLVFSTLHTNDAVSTITRLTDMGIEPYLLSSTLLGVMAQRLVRVNCSHCVAEEEVDVYVRKSLNLLPNEKFYRGKGCELCNHMGYRGRVTVCEMLAVTPEIAQLINDEAPMQKIQAVAMAQGMTRLGDNAIALAREGKTSIQEILSVQLESA